MCSLSGRKVHIPPKMNLVPQSLAVLGLLFFVIVSSEVPKPLMCYVCNSHPDIHGPKCAKNDHNELKEFLMDCNKDDGTGLNNEFLKAVYGELEGGLEPKAGAKAGWFKDLKGADGTPEAGTEGDLSLTVQHVNSRTYLHGKEGNKTLYREPPYDVCRMITVETPETVVESNPDKSKDASKLNKMKPLSGDTARIIRMCGRINKHEGPTLTRCKNYRGKGGSMQSCVCKGESADKPCNGAPGISAASGLILASAGVLFVRFFL